MKTIHLRGLLWLYLFGFGYMSLALEPGQFLDFDNLPDTNFTCVGKVIGGYYADLETNCQMFHVCTIGQLDEPMDIRFLCLNGTVFDQETRVCERIDEVDCAKSERFYSLNLELYGNTQPPFLEESPETDLPVFIKSSTSTSTTTTTTTTTSTTPKPIRQHSTTRPPIVTTVSNSKLLSNHHFPLSNPPDIRFNPEEINISLNAGAPPIIKKTPTFHHQSNLNDDDNNDKQVFVEQLKRPLVITTTQKPKTIVSYDLTHNQQQQQQQPNPVTPSDINYSFTYRSDDSDELYHDTETTPQHYQYRSNYANYNPEIYRLRTTTPNLRALTTTQHIDAATTFRNPFVPILKSPSYRHYNTEKPQKLQLPIPTLPPLTFSSPAPFSLTQHTETKRYTNEQQPPPPPPPPPPRIVISASASVSDASGRRLNYSLGTIGLTPLLEETSAKFDDEYYKDHDLETFFHDVPKIRKQNREKRNVPLPQGRNVSIKTEQEAVDVLAFLFDWYKQKSKSTTINIPVKPDDITDINQQLTTDLEAAIETETDENSTEINVYNGRDNNLFKRGSRFNIIGDILSITETETAETTTTTTENYQHDDINYDYIDDNYEPLTFQEEISNNDSFTTEATVTTENNPQTSSIEAENYRTETPTTETTTVYSQTTTTPETDATITTDFDRSTTTTETATEWTVTPEILEEKSTTERTVTPEILDEKATTEWTVTPEILEQSTTERTLTSEILEKKSTTERTVTPEILEEKATTERTLTSEISEEKSTTESITETAVAETTPPILTTTTSRLKLPKRPNRWYNSNAVRKPLRTRSGSYHRFGPGFRSSTSDSPYLTTTTTTTERTTTERTDSVDDIPSTDPPLDKSANPTQAEIVEQKELNTTPLSSFDKVSVHRKTYIFNCFDKPLNRFYSDPRDCRLFHYCTTGYTKNQLLDMKFVCDLGTYFDDEKLICTKTQSARCL